MFSQGGVILRVNRTRSAIQRYRINTVFFFVPVIGIVGQFSNNRRAQLFNLGITDSINTLLTPLRQ
ncbi:hypothetical protein N5923_03910 [Erwiniaceae bacterium BAC15a-03b]|uniref:Uncharacterized protein n=1 Tax=Winslowiella arboricola TaxID=2978220 RepID=A0A9J6PIU6_9GAMM|nr:hypothetical protein [Winslowiella arboricola]MCU5771796.1 hypothetical protein [Winslowiella arboricola]MCU5776646.1 hypothetical protein [Winslowiella arboricola]